LNTRHKRYSNHQLNSGCPTAHRMGHLMLLPSGPDMVRDVLLHRTGISTPVNLRQSSHRMSSKTEFSPAGADCRYRAPLPPHLARHTKSYQNQNTNASQTYHSPWKRLEKSTNLNSLARCLDTLYWNGLASFRCTTERTVATYGGTL